MDTLRRMSRRFHAKSGATEAIIIDPIDKMLTRDPACMSATASACMMPVQKPMTPTNRALRQ